MSSTYIDLLLNLLDRPPPRFVRSAGGGAQARALIAQQVPLYKDLKGIFVRIPFGGGNHAGGSVDAPTVLVDILNSCITRLEQGSPDTEDTPDGFVIVRSTLPVIHDDDVQALKQHVKSLGHNGEETLSTAPVRTSGDAQEMAFLMCGALICEAQFDENVPLNVSQNFNSNVGIRIVSQLTYYAAAKAERQNSPIVGEAIKAQLADLDAKLENRRVEFDAVKVHEKEELEKLALRNVALSSTQADVADAFEKTEKRIENFEKSIREQLRLSSTRQTWASNYEKGRIDFAISIGILVIFFLTAIAVPYYFGERVIDAVNAFDLSALLSGGSVGTSVAHQLSRLVVVSVPIVVFLWMLRAAMRYFMRSLLLMDDARQRQTMLETYFLLIEAGRADERDRPLVLWALFRQTPGHGPDGIEPPNFTEVINAGMKRSEA